MQMSVFEMPKKFNDMNIIKLGYKKTFNPHSGWLGLLLEQRFVPNHLTPSFRFISGLLFCSLKFDLMLADVC